MLNYTIGAVKKKSTAKKKTTAKKSVAKKTRKVSAKSKVSKVTGERYFPSTPAKDKGYKVTSTCSTAGANPATRPENSCVARAQYVVGY